MVVNKSSLVFCGVIAAMCIPLFFWITGYTRTLHAQIGEISVAEGQLSNRARYERKLFNVNQYYRDRLSHRKSSATFVFRFSGDIPPGGGQVDGCTIRYVNVFVSGHESAVFMVWTT